MFFKKERKVLREFLKRGSEEKQDPEVAYQGY